MLVMRYPLVSIYSLVSLYTLATPQALRGWDVSGRIGGRCLEMPPRPDSVMSPRVEFHYAALQLGVLNGCVLISIYSRWSLKRSLGRMYINQYVVALGHGINSI